MAEWQHTPATHHRRIRKVGGEDQYDEWEKTQDEKDEYADATLSAPIRAQIEEFDLDSIDTMGTAQVRDVVKLLMTVARWSIRRGRL